MQSHFLLAVARPGVTEILLFVAWWMLRLASRGIENPRYKRSLSS